MNATEVRVELLLGAQVRALNGKSVGRIEEIRIDLRDGVGFVEEFLVGTYAFFERLSAFSIARGIFGVFGSRFRGGYRVRWDQLDLSDPAQPRLMCSVSELLPLQGEQHDSEF